MHCFFFFSEDGAFRGLVSLQTLFLQNNAITDLPVLTDVVELRELYLQNNDISNLPDNTDIPSDNKIERLDLSHNKFTSVPNALLKQFKALKYLNLCKLEFLNNRSTCLANNKRRLFPKYISKMNGLAIPVITDVVSVIGIWYT